MALSAGSTLGAYEIMSPLGSGGMGEVYRARDTKLGRAVAIKVLPEAFAFDPDRVARFEREAKVLASLNHPHIAALHGMEVSDGRHFLIMELVEGETLADRLRRGAIPVEEALRIAIQMADALEAAHEKGVIHRDLKPANVKVTPDDKVKVLDFGLAKAMDPAAAGPVNPTHSPTLSLMATQAGMILGTAAYMSPEQAKGLPADHRSDVFSFGCVLYETLTGRQPFQGDTTPDILASVLAREPDLSALPPNLNPRLTDLLKRCLDKHPKRRWQAVGDLRAELEAIAAAPHVAPAAAAASARLEPVWRRLALFSVPALILGAAAAGGTVWFAVRPAPPRVTKTTITAGGEAALTINGLDHDLAITPDGARVVYVGNNGTQLFVRALDELEPTVIAAGANLRGPFVSPDGQWVGFLENNVTLRKVAITGGPPITLSRISGTFAQGATWATDDTIIVATNAVTTGLDRVPAAGGTFEALTRPDRDRGEGDHSWPSMLPGGRGVLFTIIALAGGLDAAQVAVLDLSTGAQKVLVRGGSDAQYVASGHLVYVAAGSLRAVPFDLDRLEVRGTAVPVLPRLATTGAGAGDFAIASNGTHVYVDAPSAAVNSARTLVWVDRTGKEEPIAAPPRNYVNARVSPDGTRLVVFSADEEWDLWIWDLRRATFTRLTFEPGQDGTPIWTPDGRRIIFGSDRDGGVINLWAQTWDGTGAAERLAKSGNIQVPTGTSADGADLLYLDVTPAGVDIRRLPLTREPGSALRQPQGGSDSGREAEDAGRGVPLVQTKFNERNAVAAPNGRWIAYESDSSGRPEILVRPFPDASAGQRQVSTAGGTRPLWAPDGRELFYMAPDGALMRVAVEAGETWNAGAPAKLLEGRYLMGLGFPTRPYDISPDGRRFLMIKETTTGQAAPPPSIIVVQHWDEELKARVPSQ